MECRTLPASNRDGCLFCGRRRPAPPPLRQRFLRSSCLRQHPLRSHKRAMLKITPSFAARSAPHKCSARIRQVVFQVAAVPTGGPSSRATVTSRPSRRPSVLSCFKKSTARRALQRSSCSVEVRGQAVRLRCLLLVKAFRPFRVAFCLNQLPSPTAY